MTKVNHKQVLALLLEGFTLKEILSSENYLKKKYLLLKLSGLAKLKSKNILDYIDQDALNEALYNSANYEYLELIKYLVEQGANIHFNNDEAIMWSAHFGHLKIVKYLVSKGANIYANNSFALFSSIDNGHKKVSEFLRLKSRESINYIHLITNIHIIIKEFGLYCYIRCVYRYILAKVTHKKITFLDAMLRE